MTATTVSSCSCWTWGRVAEKSWRPTARAVQIATASGHAEPHQANRLGSALAREERGDDADDESGLEALAQADDERRKHR